MTLHLFKYWSLSYFCTFVSNQSNLPHNILLRTLIWGLFFYTTWTHMHLLAFFFFFCCTWNHSISSPFSSFICYLSAVDWPKEGHIESWVHIWFDSTTCAWDSFALYIYICKQISSLNWYVFMFMSMKGKNVTDDIWNGISLISIFHELTGSRVYDNFLRSRNKNKFGGWLGIMWTMSCWNVSKLMSVGAEL